MGDLIERLRADEWASNATLRREAADEIERLREDLGVVDAWRNKVIAENAKLQAVVDAVKHLLAGGDKEALYYLEQALAVLEDDDG